MADTGKPYGLVIPTEYNNDWYSAFVSLIQSIATVVGISEAQMSNCHDYKFLIQDINERLKSHIDSQDTVLDLKTALTKLDLGYGLNQLNVMWDALQFYHQREREFKRFMNEYDNTATRLDISNLFTILNEDSPMFLATKTSNQTITTAGIPQEVTFDTIDYDTNNNYNVATSLYTPTIPGLYLFNAQIEWITAITDASYFRMYLTRNGASIKNNILVTSGVNQTHHHCITHLERADGNDYFGIEVYHAQGTDRTLKGDSGIKDSVYFQGIKVARLVT